MTSPATLPRLNWFSPLPPQRSGIADYTAALAPALRARASTTFVSQDEPSGALPGAKRLDAITRSEINLADFNVFHLGNHAGFHDRIWRTSTASGGVVVLHDARLLHFFHSIFVIDGARPDRFRAAMRAFYGADGESAAALLAEGRAAPEAFAEAHPMVELALRGAAGVVVHSDEALRIVQARVDIPAIRLDLPYDAGAVPTPRHDGIDRARPLRCLVFGHIGHNRRVELLLEAMAQIGSRCAIELDIAGEVINLSRLADKVRSLGLERRVAIRGHVPEPALDALIAAADVVVNLRWPTMGEASYSQLRAWRHGAATVVTDAGWYGELPRDAVAHVRPGHEVDDLAQALLRFDADRALAAAMGARGRARLIERHAPVTYVERLLGFAASVARSLRPVHEDLAQRVAAAVVDVPPALAAALLDRIDAVTRPAQHASRASHVSAAAVPLPMAEFRDTLHGEARQPAAAEGGA